MILMIQILKSQHTIWKLKRGQTKLKSSLVKLQATEALLAAHHRPLEIVERVRAALRHSSRVHEMIGLVIKDEEDDLEQLKTLRRSLKTAKQLLNKESAEAVFEVEFSEFEALALKLERDIDVLTQGRNGHP